MQWHGTYIRHGWASVDLAEQHWRGSGHGVEFGKTIIAAQTDPEVVITGLSWDKMLISRLQAMLFSRRVGDARLKEGCNRKSGPQTRSRTSECRVIDTMFVLAFPTAAYLLYYARMHACRISRLEPHNIESGPECRSIPGDCLPSGKYRRVYQCFNQPSID
jgi:hypothetical protein